MDRIKIKLLTLVYVLLSVLSLSGMPAHAAEADRVWIRAKLTYEYEEGVTGLGDNVIKFTATDWKKNGDWYYYVKPVESGQTIRFMEGVQIPTEWDNKAASKNFKIIVHVQASEAVYDNAGWDSNTEVSYSQTFDIWNKDAKHSNTTYIKQGNISIALKEYEMKDGKKVDYENDKVVVPGQFVSKIVEFTIKGSKGGIFEKEKPTPTPAPTPATPAQTVPAHLAPIPALIQQVVARATGDGSYLLWYAGALLVAAVALFIYFRRRKAKKRED